MTYQLPTHPSIPCNDPLSILDDEAASQAELLDALLQAALERVQSSPADVCPDILPDLIEDIAYSVHGNGAIDTTYLRDESRSLGKGTIVSMLQAAQRLPQEFPTHAIDFTTPGGNLPTFTGAQVDSLLAHQFLGTLSSPPGTDWGMPCFTSWFESDPAHPKAVQGYLSTIFNHFAQGDYSGINEPTPTSFSFSMHDAKDMPEPVHCSALPNVRLHVVSEESEPSEDPGTPFVLVAAHSQPGPGPTGTQEERLQSASPALSLSALVSPVIPSDAAVVTSAIPVYAAWEGHNRTARLIRLYEKGWRPKRHYILADALPLDEVEDKPGFLKDLQPGLVEREARKLYAAFSGAVKMQVACGTNVDEPCVIEAGAWGCGAFGGDIVVKTICIMIAAGLAGIEVRLTLLESRVDEIAYVQELLGRQCATSRLWELVTSAKTFEDLKRTLS